MNDLSGVPDSGTVFPVPEALGGERIDRVVSLATGCSRAEASAAVSDGVVLVDGRPARNRSARVEPGQMIDVGEVGPAPPMVPEADPAVRVDVLSADDDVVVVNKPPGLVVHPAPGHWSGTLVHGLLARFPELATVGEVHRPGIVHRLDRDTSGLMVVARTPRAYVDLVEQLSSHRVERLYRALVWGHPASDAGVIDAPVGRSVRDARKMSVTRTGRMARTHYRTLVRWDEPRELAAMELELETGRTHQIRVHLRSIGHPIVGDPVYGREVTGRLLGRPFLHAGRLGFVHPGTGAPVRWEVGLPEDLWAWLGRLPASPPLPGSWLPARQG